MTDIRLRCPLCGLLTIREATDRTPFQCQNETCGEDGAAAGATELAALTLRMEEFYERTGDQPDADTKPW